MAYELETHSTQVLTVPIYLNNAAIDLPLEISIQLLNYQIMRKCEAHKQFVHHIIG